MHCTTIIITMQEGGKMRKKIIAELSALKAPKSNLGFEYLVEAIEIKAEKGNSINMTELYIKIAENNETTLLRVERAIRHEIGIICSVEETEEQRCEIFSTSDKLKNSEFIACMAYYLKE